MSYIHPREINVNQPRLKLPIKKYFKYYVGLGSCERKLRSMLGMFQFSTVSEVMAGLKDLPEFRLHGNQIQHC
jgi:hypothetical protein